jgi:uncharacterized protein (UPF0332 family)
MNQNDRQALVQYRLSRAREAYEEALLMQREHHWNACANRLYYACFYAINALLVKTGYASSKHTGVRSYFNQHFVKTGKVDKVLGRLFNELFEARQEGDYVDFVQYDEALIAPWIHAVKKFIDRLARLALEETEA